MSPVIPATLPVVAPRAGQPNVSVGIVTQDAGTDLPSFEERLDIELERVMIAAGLMAAVRHCKKIT